jgi:very-short-patch-repair endonuclease
MAREMRYSKSSLVKAKQMRREPSLAEKIFWKELRRKQIEGVRFRRQQQSAHTSPITTVAN